MNIRQRSHLGDLEVTFQNKSYILRTLATFVFLVAVASAQSGAVSSHVTPTPKDSTAAGNADETKLSWKFLASPMGAFTDSTLDSAIDSLSTCSDPKGPPPSPKVEKLLAGTIGPIAEARLAGQKAQYVIIHVVDAKSGPTGADAWYLYRSAKGNYGDPRWTCQTFTGQRIYGAGSVLFLFLHRHAKVVTLSSALSQVKAAISKASTDTTLPKGLAQVQELDSDLATALKKNQLDVQGGPPVTFCDKDLGDHFQWLGDNGLPTTYANIHYEAAVVRRTPANVANLKSILGLLFGSQGREASCLDIASSEATIWGAGSVQNIGLPSDISIAGYSQGTDTPLKPEDRTTKQIGAVGTYNDEQLYWWDASIGIPVHKIKDLQYSDSNDTVTATQVDKQSAYAMFNLMLRPVDLSEPSSNLWPRLLVGFPLANNPWDKLFAGGGIGLPLKPFQNFQFFAGATFIRTQQPATLTAGATATSAQLQNDLRIKTTPKFTFGINVPVKSVIDKLK